MLVLFVLPILWRDLLAHEICVSITHDCIDLLSYM